MIHLEAKRYFAQPDMSKCRLQMLNVTFPFYLAIYPALNVKAICLSDIDFVQPAPIYILNLV